MCGKPCFVNLALSKLCGWFGRVVERISSNLGPGFPPHNANIFGGLFGNLCIIVGRSLFALLFLLLPLPRCEYPQSFGRLSSYPCSRRPRFPLPRLNKRRIVFMHLFPGPRSQSSRYSLGVVARCSSSQAAGHLLERPAAPHSLGRGHALLKSADLKFVSGHKGRQVQLAILERSIGGLSRDISCSVDLGALLEEGIATTVGSWRAALFGGWTRLPACRVIGSHSDGELASFEKAQLRS